MGRIESVKFCRLMRISRIWARFGAYNWINLIMREKKRSSVACHALELLVLIDEKSVHQAVLPITWQCICLVTLSNVIDR